MNPLEMVVIIVFLGIVGSIITTAIKEFGNRQERRGSAAARQAADELRDQIVRLEERIQVLERIVTDTSGRENLRRQFRDLEHGG